MSVQFISPCFGAKRNVDQGSNCAKRLSGTALNKVQLICIRKVSVKSVAKMLLKKSFDNRFTDMQEYCYTVNCYCTEDRE